jgi:hypothetical protein
VHRRGNRVQTEFRRGFGNNIQTAKLLLKLLLPCGELGSFTAEETEYKRSFAEVLELLGLSFLKTAKLLLKLLLLCGELVGVTT